MRSTPFISAFAGDHGVGKKSIGNKAADIVVSLSMRSPLCSIGAVTDFE
jgi:hypothetical protein